MRRRDLIVLALSLGATPAAAESFAVGAVSVDRPWAKPSVTEAAAVFMTLHNDGPRADRLVGGVTPIAERVILRELDGTALEFMDLEPHRPAILRPGRRYIALRGLKRLLAIDDSFPLQLRFAEAGPIELIVGVAEGLSYRLATTGRA